MRTLHLKRVSILLISFVFFTLAMTGYAHAQIIVRGKVIDRKDKAPVPGATVIEVNKEKRTINGVSTDIDGNFALRVTDQTNRISVSFIGYKSHTEDIKGRTVINIQLEPSETQLGEVSITAKKTVNNGTGLNIDERNRTTAVVTVNAKDLEELQSASIDQALQGRLPGVDISATSGDPGAGMQIRIRGTSSINGATDPLIVVDGMPYETTIPEDFNFATSDENNYAQLLNIAPSDIKDISVLKDAAATAIWGSRAANGVLIINTKRGAIGKPSITYTLKSSLSKQPDPIPLLTGNQYSSLVLEEYYNSGRQFSSSEYAKQFQYDPNDPYNYYNFSQNTDWVGAITQTGTQMDHNVSLSGGGERARYYTSLGYYNQEGTTKGTGLTRVNARINLDYNVSDRIRFKTDISYTHVDNNALFAGDVRNIAYSKMPNMSIYEYDEYGNKTSNYFSPAVTAQGYFYYDDKNKIKGTYNPLAMVMEATNRQLGDRVTPHFNVQYDIIPAILLGTADIQFDINNTKTKTFLPEVATGRPFTETTVNRASDADADQFNVQSKLNLVFTPKVTEKHSFQGLLSIQSSDSRYQPLQLMSANSASSELQDPSTDSRTANSELVIKAVPTQTRSIAGLISAQYGYLDRYLVNVGLRGEGNSKFGPANRYGLFPSVSTRWRISGEPFLAGVEAINDLSLRASYGQSGNAPKYDYTFYNLYETYNYTYLGQTGIRSTNIELSNLKWETVTGKNLGANLIMFDNRLSVDVEVYRNRTKNMYYEDLGIASYTGYSKIDMNVGTMDNQGWELGIGGTPIRGKNLKLDLNFNISQNQNMIREISPLYPRESDKSVLTNENYKEYLKEDNPFGSFYGYKFLGVYRDEDATIAMDQNGNPIVGPNGESIRMRFNYPAVDYVFQPGDARYADLNYDGTIDEKDIMYLGNGNPQFTGGFGTSLTWKGRLKLNTYFTFRTGYELINYTKMTTSNMYGFNNQSTAVLGRWREPGDDTDVPRALYGQGYNWLGSSRYVEDASFLRLRSVTVRYDFDRSLLQNIGFRGLSFYVTGENLLTFTKYTGQDPEVTTKITSPFSVAMDKSYTPPVKTFTLGISAQF